uniref:hypothetical protein n=1 Tax=Segatella hominis TaxID=2518605 RepID=UPI004038A376
MKEKKFIFLLLYMLYSSNGGGMSGQKNDAAGSVGFFRQSLCDLFFFALVVDIEMGEFDFSCKKAVDNSAC